MTLSAVKENIISSLTTVKDRAQKNWNNMSTVGKVATVALSLIAVYAAIGTAIFGHLALAALAVGAGLSAVIIPSSTAGFGILGFTIPAVALFRKPEVAEPAIELTTAAPVAAVESAEQPAEVVVEAPSEVEEKPSLLEKFKRVLSL